MIPNAPGAQDYTVRERLLRLGPGPLSIPELYSLVLSHDAVSGSGQLAARYPRPSAIYTQGPRAVMRSAGVGLAGACRLVAGIELGLRLTAEGNCSEPLVTPDAIHRAMHKLTLLQVETVVALALSGEGRLLAEVQVAQGTAASCSLTPRDVLVPMVREGAERFVLVHNHPSGDPTPSLDDTHFTLRLQRACETVGIRLHDHVVVATGGYTSLRQRGIVP